MNIKFNKALVTGGAGFIGSHLVEALVAGKCMVVVVDNLSSGRLSNLEQFKDRITFVRGDIRQNDILAFLTSLGGIVTVSSLAVVVVVGILLFRAQRSGEIQNSWAFG